MSETREVAPMPGLLVARHVLWRIAMWCTVIGLGNIVATSLIPGSTQSGGFQFLTVVTGIILYTGLACWIAYAVVRMVGRYRLPTSS